MRNVKYINYKYTRSHVRSPKLHIIFHLGPRNLYVLIRLNSPNKSK